MPALADYLSADHARLDALLSRAIEDPAAYYEFRRGLLRHIAIEEKVLFPLLKELDEHRTVVGTLRLQHGALGALLVPKVSPQIHQAISDILHVHNAIEEGTEGVYAEVERRAAGSDLLGRAMAIGEVPLSPAIDKLTDLAPVWRAVARAGFDPAMYSV